MPDYFKFNHNRATVFRQAEHVDLADSTIRANGFQWHLIIKKLKPGAIRQWPTLLRVHHRYGKVFFSTVRFPVCAGKTSSTSEIRAA
jgi:hypothetical protein